MSGLDTCIKKFDVIVRKCFNNSINDNDTIKPSKDERLPGGQEIQQRTAEYQYIHVHIVAMYIRAPIVPAPYTFRSSFERTAKSEIYGRRQWVGEANYIS